MNKNLFIGVVMIIIVGIGAYFLINQSVQEAETSQQPQAQEAVFDGRNTTFTMEGKPVTLVRGVSETPVENSSAKITTRYFGNETEGDLNGDGLEDQAFLVTQNTGGSGTFYYMVVALKNNEGYKTTNAFFIGDRIAPQSTEIRADVRELLVNYADRKQGEPMSSQPSEGKTLLLKVTPSGALEGLMQ